MCNKKNCILCKAIHDGMNCQEYQDDLKRHAVNDAAAKATQDMLEVWERREGGDVIKGVQMLEREGEGEDAAKAVLTLKCVNEIHRASCVHL